MKDVMEDTWLDLWLNEHPRADRFMMCYVYPVEVRIRRALRVRQNIREFKFKRQFKPGTFYLDHGSVPCVLVKIYGKSLLSGVSLVDGRSISGCDLWACGPEPVSEAAAHDLADKLRKEQQ